MGYDLHIVRTLNWVDAADAPITRDEVSRLIDSDADLEWSALDYLSMKLEDGQIERFPLINWRGHPCFWWYQDQITVSSPNEAQIAKAIRVASALNAYAIGDDGERYELHRTFLGGEKIKTLRPQN